MLRDDANDLGESEPRAGFGRRRKVLSAESLKAPAVTMCEGECELLFVKDHMKRRMRCWHVA